MRHVGFSGRLVMLGFGSIGQGVLPLKLRHIGIVPGLLCPTVITIPSIPEIRRPAVAHRQ